jgi:type I restriction enzyme S subunit
LSSEQKALKGFESEESKGEKVWEEKKLNEVAHINLGQSPKGEYYNEEGEGPHFIQGSKNFGHLYPKLERYCSQPKREAEKGDVLISVRAPVGPVNIAPERLCIGRGVTALRMNDGSNKFLYYFLKYFEDKWSQYADGTTFNSITKADLKDLEIPYPPKNERNKIATVLSNLDDKIETNNRIKEILDELAQTLFEYWFDSFQPYNDFKDTEIGKIPKDFTVENLTDIAEVTYGYSFDSEDFNEKGEGSPVIRIRDLEKSKTGKFSPEEYEEKYHITPGDVLVRMDRLFRSHIWKGPEGGLNQRVCKFESEKELCSNMFLYLVLKKPLAKLEASKTGTTVIHLGKKDIDSIKIAYPDSDSLRKFNNITQPIYAEIVRREEENRELKAVRNTLLPKLMSGEIRVNVDGDE